MFVFFALAENKQMSEVLIAKAFFSRHKSIRNTEAGEEEEWTGNDKT